MALRWTLESVGINIMKLNDAENGLYPLSANKNYKNDLATKLPKVSNGNSFFTFFEETSLPNLPRYEGVNIQDYLQSHYIKSIICLAKKISKFKNVVGFGIT